MERKPEAQSGSPQTSKIQSFSTVINSFQAFSCQQLPQLSILDVCGDPGYFFDYFACIYRSSQQRCSINKCVLKNFPKFLGKHLCQSLFFNKVAGYFCKVFFRKHFFFSQYYKHGQNILERLQLLCEIAHYGKSSIPIFKESFASNDKIFFLGGRLGTRFYFHEALTLF